MESLEHNCGNISPTICTNMLTLGKISLTSFLCFSFFFFFCFFFFFFFFSNHSYLCNKKKITRWFEHIEFIFSWKYFEDKLHMFALPRNILHIFVTCTKWRVYSYINIIAVENVKVHVILLPSKARGFEISPFDPFDLVLSSQ